MAIKIGSDGTLYCNTVKYNYKQARNMIADGSYGNISGPPVWDGVTDSINPAGYKSYRCFNLNRTYNLIQKLPALYYGKKYYFSCRYSTANTSVASIVIRNNTTDICSIFDGITSSSSSWSLGSAVFTPPTNITKDNANICGWNGTTDSCLYVCKFILIDLTDTFGAGREPTKEWCDKNILEQEKITGYGCTSSNVSYSNFSTNYKIESAQHPYNFNYLELDGTWEPREYMHMITGASSALEAYILSTEGFALNNTQTYYAYMEYHTLNNITNSNLNFDFYFPIAEPAMGSVKMVNNASFNSGGGMSDWKRVSFFNNRRSFQNGSYQLRFDFNNNKQEAQIRVTAINLLNVSDNVTVYNNNRPYGTPPITLSDVNKEWCDRWIDGRSSPIIHIKDPYNKTIKFNTEYDICCNDIEIRPETNKVTFNHETGTIYCKKLIKTEQY